MLGAALRAVLQMIRLMWRRGWGRAMLVQLSRGVRAAVPPETSWRASSASIDCACYFTENFYVRTPVEGHFTFDSLEEFEQENGELLDAIGVPMAQELKANLLAEAERRRAQPALAEARKVRIASEYTRLHPTLWTLSEEWLHPDFIVLVGEARRRVANGAGAASTTTLWRPPRALAEGVYVLRVFSERFCALLCEELDAFAASGLPCGRPNSMNRYGALLDELGFAPGLLNPLVSDWLRPLCAALEPLAAAGGASVDSHKSFVVTYRLGEDEDLAQHYDNSEVTLNVNLGLDFDEGELVFYGDKRTATASPIASHDWAEAGGVGHAVLHLGSHVHAALPISSGERRNLVVWMRSSRWRHIEGCAMCGSAHRLLHDGGSGGVVEQSQNALPGTARYGDH